MSTESDIAESETRMVRVLGQRIRVEVRPGKGVPLVLCNGIGAGLEVLDPLVDRLPDIPIVRFDVPGTGGSPNSPLPYGFPYLACVLGRVLTKLRIDRADILGCPGAERSRSSSRSRTPGGADGWCWCRRRPVCSCCPHTPGCC